MIDKVEVQKVLQEFLDSVIEKSKANLNSASGKLAQSMQSEVKVTDKSIVDATITGEDYLQFQHKGVSGINVKYDTPFSYKNKPSGGKRPDLAGMPPPSAFDKWNIIRGRSARDERGQFLSRKSLNFATAVSVFKKGIKPTLFFTKAFESEFKTLPDEIVEAYALDMESFMDFALNKN